MTVISESYLGEKTFRANLNTCGEFHTSEGFRRRRKLKLSETERERECVRWHRCALLPPMAVRVSWVPASANTSKERGRDRESVGEAWNILQFLTLIVRFDWKCIIFWPIILLQNNTTVKYETIFLKIFYI